MEYLIFINQLGVIGFRYFTGHLTLSHSTLVSCSTVLDRHRTKLQNDHSLQPSFHPAYCLKAKGRSEMQQDDSDWESLLVLGVGEGTSAGFAVVMETSHHSVEAGRAAFTVLALRVVLTILHKHIITIVLLTFANANCWFPIHSTTWHDTGVFIFPSVFSKQ